MVIFAGTLIFYTCGKSQPQTDNQIYIGVACYDQKDTFIEELVDAFKEQCSSMESKDYAISMTIMDASNSQRVQNDQIEQMINDGCNVLCVNLADRTEPSEIIDAAKEKDIPIIFFNREPVEEDMRRWDKLYYVGGKAKQSGELQGELAADFIKVNPQADRNNYSYRKRGRKPESQRYFSGKTKLSDCKLEPCTGTDQNDAAYRTIQNKY